MSKKAKGERGDREHAVKELLEIKVLTETEGGKKLIRDMLLEAAGAAAAVAGAETDDERRNQAAILRARLDIVSRLTGVEGRLEAARAALQELINEEKKVAEEMSDYRIRDPLLFAPEPSP
jgi:hypothetical protein